MVLTSNQEAALIDFLKRWGIDSPELLAEMTDHYAVRAEEMMREGKTFDRTLDSWKTKSTFLQLRKIQSEYERTFRKRWFRSHIQALKQVFLTKQVLLLILGGLLIRLGYHSGYETWISWVFMAKSVGIVLFLGYLYRSDLRYRRFWELRFTGFFWIGSYLIISELIKSDFPEEPFLLPESLLYIVLLIDFVGYNLWKEVETAVKSLTKIYFLEPQIPVRS
jgi:hypothetical protein